MLISLDLKICVVLRVLVLAMFGDRILKLLCLGMCCMISVGKRERMNEKSKTGCCVFFLAGFNIFGAGTMPYFSKKKDHRNKK
jgi:hypothetical protein